MGFLTVLSWMFSGPQENYESVPIDDSDFEDTESAGGSDFAPNGDTSTSSPPSSGFPGGSDFGSNGDTSTSSPPSSGFPGGSDFGSNGDSSTTSNKPQTPANPAQPPSTLNSQGLDKIIRNPDTGVTYYLDERVNKYYYVDATTKQSVYYN